MVFSRVFLVDHAWTYRVNEARTRLQNSPSLLNRMCDLMHIDISASNTDVNDNPEEREKLLVDAVYENMWKHNQHYKLSTNFQKMVLSMKSYFLSFFGVFQVTQILIHLICKIEKLRHIQEISGEGFSQRMISIFYVSALRNKKTL